jgi:hypothetical protein
MNHKLSEKMIPVFASTKLKLHPREYMIVSLPLGEKEKVLDFFEPTEPFWSITVDTEEVSLILEENNWELIKGNFLEYQIEGPYTFDIVLDLNLIGYLSVISDVLAKAGVSIFVVSTYLRDHILVKSEDSYKAMQVLDELVQRCKSYPLLSDNQ